MTQTQVPGRSAQRTPVLNERDNERAVDAIESAERSAPYCLCGRHMIAVADGGRIWLECSGRAEEKGGLAGLLARITAFSHTRYVILELPAT